MSHVSARFTGWDESAFDVLLRLEGVPSRGVMDAVRRDRERLVRQPMVSLLYDLAVADPVFEDHSVWRYGKTPWWWQNQCALVRISPTVEIGLRFSLDGLLVQGAWWHADSDQIARFRVAVADRTIGPRLADVLADLRDAGFEITGDVMKRVPRGCPADHPRADLLRHRSLLAACHLGCDEVLHGPEAVDGMLAAYARLRPLLAWLARYVTGGPGAPPV
jgi:hypothetical protein